MDYEKMNDKELLIELVKASKTNENEIKRIKNNVLFLFWITLLFLILIFIGFVEYLGA